MCWWTTVLSDWPYPGLGFVRLCWTNPWVDGVFLAVFDWPSLNILGIHWHIRVLMFGATLSQGFNWHNTHFFVGSYCLRAGLFKDLIVLPDCLRALMFKGPIDKGQILQGRNVQGQIVWGPDCAGPDCTCTPRSAGEVAEFSWHSCRPTGDADGHYPINQHGKDLSPLWCKPAR
jgi:hypothetical protein